MSARGFAAAASVVVVVVSRMFRYFADGSITIGEAAAGDDESALGYT